MVGNLAFAWRFLISWSTFGLVLAEELYAMPAHVNLDALIKREDFEIVGEGDSPTKPSIEIRELERDGFFFAGLRKPDFQRETSEWDPKRVAGLIRTYRRLPRTSMHQPLLAEDVARLALFLASDDSAMITKQCYQVDGGLR
jgi:hypothetical protein